MKKIILVLAFLMFQTSGFSQESLNRNIPLKFEPFSLTQVRLLDGPFKLAQQQNKAYLDMLDSDRLLKKFRVNASLPAPGEDMGLWEAPDCEIRGHFTGHYLSALAMMYASTGDESLKAKGDYLVSELAKCQAALGGKYLSAFPENFFDRVEAGRPVWVPYYTVHKIMAGLFDQYQYCRNKQALEILVNMAEYFKTRTDRLNDEQMALVLQLEHGGMAEVLFNLYTATRDKKHLALAERFCQDEFLRPLINHEDKLTKLHANTNVPKVIGAARRFEITGDCNYASASSFFWDRVIKTRSFATGGTSNIELWPEPYKLSDTLGDKNQECCVTHNMLKLTRHLACWTGDPQYADYYERALYNSVLGTSGPQPGMLLYFIPLATGYAKSFGNAYMTFWCCYGTGIESFSKLNDSIYFHDSNGIYVNLFISSALNWSDKGIELIQKSELTGGSNVSFTVKTDRQDEFALNIRIPFWATGQVQVKLNGQPLAADCRPSSYFTLRRTWSNNDRVDLVVPMNLHTVQLPGELEKVAYMYGPLVLAGILSDSDSSEYPRDSVESELVNSGYFFLSDSIDDTSWLKMTGPSSQSFEASGQPYKIKFKPLNAIVNEKYGIYWPSVAKASPAHELLKERHLILAFLKDAATASTIAQVNDLQARYDLLIKKLKLTRYHDSIVFAMAQALQRNGVEGPASNLAQSLVNPFVARDKYWQFKTILGKTQPDKPLLVSSDLENFDGSSRVIELDGKLCVATDKNKQLAYFALPMESRLKNINHTVQMTITYYSMGLKGDSFQLEYDGNEPKPYGSAYCAPPKFEKSLQKGWAQATLQLPVARFSGKQNLESDFRINSLSDGDEYISDIQITLKQE